MGFIVIYWIFLGIFEMVQNAINIQMNQIKQKKIERARFAIFLSFPPKSKIYFNYMNSTLSRPKVC